MPNDVEAKKERNKNKSIKRGEGGRKKKGKEEGEGIEQVASDVRKTEKFSIFQKNLKFREKESKN